MNLPVAFLVTGLLLFNLLVSARAEGIVVSPAEIQWIGEKVFENECAKNDECLLAWNEGEDFLSLGIGHFIWYPQAQGQSGPFEESFIKLLEYLKTTGEKIPLWLDTNPFPGCPWASRAEFLLNRGSEKALELQQFLLTTKLKQSDFLVKRFENALPAILDSVSEEERPKIKGQFDRIASTPPGVYALIDYVNFKGLGIFPTERYQDQGWGLLQILSQMNGQENGRKALEEFVEVAKKILETRVKNAPIERNEQKWLNGWQNRVNSYLNNFGPS